MRVIKIIVAGIGLLVLASVLGTFCLVFYLDENKALLEDSFSKLLDREVRIEKGVSAKWSLTPSIALEGLWIANPAWAKGEYFARAERALVRVDVLMLLQRGLQLEDVRIQGADVLLETAEDGKGNWSFGEAGDGVNVNLGALTVENSRLSYRSPSGEVRHADIPEIRFESLESRQLELKARFTYQNAPVSVSLTSKSQVISRAGERPFKGKVQLPGTTLDVVGELKGLFELANVEVELQSERLDLQKSVLPLWSAIPMGGVLQQISGRFKTTGNSPEALIGNLSGELKMGSAALTLPGEKGEDATELALDGLSLTLAPKEPVRLRTGLVYQEQTYQVALSGGMLADLFSETKSWKALKVKIKGQVDKKPLQISGDFGPLSALHSGSGVKAKLSVHHDDLKVRLDGTFASLNSIKGSRFAVDASGPSLSRISPLLGMAIPDTPPFTLVARVEGSERLVQFKKLKVTSGKSDIGGELSVPLEQGGRIKAVLESRNLDLEPFLTLSDQPSDDTKPVVERELAPELLQGLDGSLQLKVGRLQLVAIELEQAKIDAELDKGHLKLTLAAEGERLTANVDLKPASSGWQLAIHHKGKLNLGDLIDREKLADERSQAPLDVEMQLQGTGKTLREMLGTTKGSFTMVVGEGQLSKTISSHLPLGNVLYTLLGALDPKARTVQQSTLECAVIQLDVAKGIATSSKGLAMRTNQMNVLGGGALNLRTGEINLQFKTAQRKGLGISILGIADRFIGLSGTLRDPTVVLNPTSAAAFGAAAWATGGLSVLADSILTRMTAFSNPCDHVLKAIEK